MPLHIHGIKTVPYNMKWGELVQQLWSYSIHKNPGAQKEYPLRKSVLLRRCWQDEHRILTILAQQGAQQGLWGQWLGTVTHEDAGWPDPARAPGLTQRESFLILRKTIPLQKLLRGVVLSVSGQRNAEGHDKPMTMSLYICGTGWFHRI